MSSKSRCGWCLGFDDYINYHDNEWGVPVTNDQKHFEFLTLEGAQAGLSWSMVLKKRENYRKAFNNFSVDIISQYSDADVNRLMLDKGIIRNKLKINSTITNARSFIKIQHEYGSFNQYIWSFVDFKPITNAFEHLDQVPATTDLSDKISNSLKKRGFKFVGSTIIYAYMQACGLVNDHLTGCFRWEEIAKRNVKVV